MSKLLPVMGKCKSKNELMGYEGIAARNYYQGLGALVDEEFSFSGRSKQPPRDPFNSLQQGVPVPEKERPGDATLAEWIRQCKLTGLYAEGKILFEKGGLDLNHLSEETAVNVEEDYMVCLRLLSRTDSKGKK